MLEQIKNICLDAIHLSPQAELTFDDTKSWVKARLIELDFTSEQAEQGAEKYLDFWKSPPARISHSQLASLMASEIIKFYG